MSYQERLRELKYTAPSGNEFTLQFSGLNRTGGKKAPVSEFPGQNQGAVQDLGNVTPTFPISCFITGADYDLEADRFWEALHESGPGTLSHPRWGNISVLPVPGTQTEQFVEGSGRAVFEIVFIRAEEIQFDYPTSVIDYPTQVSASVDDATDTIAESVPEEITDTKTLAGLKQQYLDFIGKITDSFNKIADVADDIKADLYQAVRDFENQIDELVLEPAKLLRASLRVYRIIGKAIKTVEDIKGISIAEKIESYKEIYNNIIDGFKQTTAKYDQAFGITNCASLSALSIATAEASTYGSFQTRTQSGTAIEDVYTLYNEIRDSIIDLEELGSFSYDYESLLSAERIKSEAINGLIDQSLNLPAERILVLDREIPPIALVHELYGNIDSLDLFIEYNNLCCDEILLIPRGREVRYYFE